MKKILKRVFVVMNCMCLGLTTPVLAEPINNEVETTYNEFEVTEEFIEDADVKITAEGYLCLTGESNMIEGSVQETECESTMLVLVPNDGTDVEETIEAIKDIKNNQTTSDACRFLDSVSNNGVSVYSSTTTTKDSSLWSVTAALTIKYTEKVINGRDAALLTNVNLSIKTPSYAHVDSVVLNYGCSGLSPNGTKTQNKNVTYGKVDANSSLTKAISCPSSWSYIYVEDTFATLGANVSISITKRTSNATTTSTKLQIINNM